MSKPTDVRLLEVKAQTERHAYRTPIKFGGRVVNDAVLVNVTVDVETRDGQRGQGFGSMPMGNVWAWPTDCLPVEVTLNAMVDLSQRLVQAANEYGEVGHPLEITHDLGHGYQAAADEVAAAGGLAEPIPRLA